MNSEPPPSLLLENFARRSLRAAYAGGKTAELHPVFDSIQRSRGIECFFQEKQLRKSESATASPARRGSGGVVEWVRFMPTCLRARERLRTPGFVVNKILNCANGRSIMPLHATRRTPRHCCLGISITPSRTALQPEHAAQTPPPPAPCSPTPLQKCLFKRFACLSRACLGKCSVSSTKRRTTDVSAPGSLLERTWLGTHVFQ